VKINFLPVGHTHEDVDQLFSKRRHGSESLQVFIVFNIYSVQHTSFNCSKIQIWWARYVRAAPQGQQPVCLKEFGTSKFSPTRNHWASGSLCLLVRRRCTTSISVMTPGSQNKKDYNYWLWVVI